MSMKIEGKTSSGTYVAPLCEDDGRIVTKSSGKYEYDTLNGNMFFANSLAMETALYTATAAIGLIIYNPPLSGVNLVWTKWAATVYATSAAMTGMVIAVGLQPTIPAGTPTVAPLTGGTLLNGSTSASLADSQASAYSVATIIAPVLVWPLFHNTAAIEIVGSEMTDGDLDGMFASAPGTCTVIGALGAAGVNVNQAIAWIEVPV
jgi:hypothetical protein